MARRFAYLLLLAPLLLPGCNVVLALFTAPAQAAAGTVMTVTIAGNIAGGSGSAGCVLQLPLAWTILTVTNDQNWSVARDNAALLATYVPEPGHYLAAFSGTGDGRTGQTLSQITLTLAVGIPAYALGQHTLKVSLAGSQSLGGAWQIQDPPGIAQFAAITAAPYTQSILVGAPPTVTFVYDGGGLPTDSFVGSWSGTAFGDVDGDGRDDLAAVNANGSGTRCWLSRPGTAWTERSAGLPTLTSPAKVAFGHLDGDGFLDLVDGNGRVFFGNGGSGWTPGAPLPLTPATITYTSVAVGDVDGDGLDDIAIGAAAYAWLQVLLNNGNRTFRNASAGLPASGTADTPTNLILADLDGDGDRDLFWAHQVTPNLWLGDGHGGWTPGGGIPGQVHSGAIGDLDGDGVPEVVAGVADLGIGVYKHVVGGIWTLLPIAGLPTANRYTAIALLDFDRDGRLDIVAGHALGVVGLDLWRNTGTGLVPEALSGLPTFAGGGIDDLAVGDFDGNTLPDLVIATTGSGATPASIRAWQDRRTGITPFGTGCGGTAFAEPLLTAIGLPQLGNAAFAMQVQTPATGALALFWFGGSRTQAPPFALPLDVGPFGAPGCTLWASLDNTYLGTVDAFGNYTVSLPVPSNPALTLQTAFSQGAVCAPGANAFGAVFTRAMALRIQ